ncbi:DUF928 domain-containing protein [Altericista sp. CCNU0014]|uniref:DUF928 domain-containing protein n=1 Tax=Altericista sp. CCNU0014 TaxID=3082949 RepID=UPI00384E05AE
MATTYLLRWTAIALSVALAGIALQPLPSTARSRYRPPSNLVRPAGRQGAATRTDCAKAGFTFAPVVPESNYGLTAAEYPTLYWYHVNHQFSWARFELYAAQPQTLELESDPIYQTTFRLNRETRLASLTLPAAVGLPPLAPGRDYLWKVTLICSQGGPDDDMASGSQRSVQGWIARVAPEAGSNAKVANASDRYDGYNAYAEKGLWYDAIHDLAVRRKLQPQNAQLRLDWRDLLQETRLKSADL